MTYHHYVVTLVRGSGRGRVIEGGEQYRRWMLVYIIRDEKKK